MAKEIFAHVPKIYRRQCLDHILFGYIIGIQKCMPSVSVKKCVIMFREENDLTESEYPTDSACTTYRRMQKEYAGLLEDSYNKKIQKKQTVK